MKINYTTFIGKLNWGKRVGVTFVNPFGAVVHDTTLTGVLTRCRTRPENLLPTVPIIPITKLGEVVLERNHE